MFPRMSVLTSAFLRTGTGGPEARRRVGWTERRVWLAHRMDDWAAVEHGVTDTVVRRSADGSRHAKSARDPALRAELAAERDRLRWLAGTDLPVPTVLDWHDDDGAATLVTGTVRGVPACELAADSGGVLVRSLADLLRRLHAVTECAVDRSLGVTLPEAHRAVAEGRVDEADFDDARMGSTAAGLLAELEAAAPRAAALEAGDLVVCHGDACLPNVLVDPATLTVTGFIDVGRLGLADRHQDLALLTRSMGAEDRNPGYAEPHATALIAA